MLKLLSVANKIERVEHRAEDKSQFGWGRTGFWDTYMEELGGWGRPVLLITLRERFRNVFKHEQLSKSVAFTKSLMLKASGASVK